MILNPCIMLPHGSPKLSKETAKDVISLANWEIFQNGTVQYRMRYLGIHFPELIVPQHWSLLRKIYNLPERNIKLDSDCQEHLQAVSFLLPKSPTN